MTSDKHGETASVEVMRPMTDEEIQHLRWQSSTALGKLIAQTEQLTWKVHRVAQRPKSERKKWLKQLVKDEPGRKMYFHGRVGSGKRTGNLAQVLLIEWRLLAYIVNYDFQLVVTGQDHQLAVRNAFNMDWTGGPPSREEQTQLKPTLKLAMSLQRDDSLPRGHQIFLQSYLQESEKRNLPTHPLCRDYVELIKRRQSRR